MRSLSRRGGIPSSIMPAENRKELGAVVADGRRNILQVAPDISQMAFLTRPIEAALFV